ncbi:hypothetical protein [Bradyrhizobium sp. STM 3562]|uniref:hypothetical protein n=1 Tax=Bradyrhizobium sp. STM 3562 TaxID=578924 RepID=UPI00388F5F2C
MKRNWTRFLSRSSQLWKRSKIGIKFRTFPCASSILMRDQAVQVPAGQCLDFEVSRDLADHSRPVSRAIIKRENRREIAVAKPLRQQPFPALPKRRFVIRSEEAIELRSLYEELPYAAMRAAEALRADGAALRGDDLLPFWRAENAVTEIIQRINEILTPEWISQAAKP